MKCVIKSEVHHKPDLINAVTFPVPFHGGEANTMFCCSWSIWLLCRHPSQCCSQEIHLVWRKFPTCFHPLQPFSAWRGIFMPLSYLLPVLSPKCAREKQGVFGALQSTGCLWQPEKNTVVWPKSQQLFHPLNLGKQPCALQLELCKGAFND